MKTLVIGFGPFPGVRKNPSADLVRALKRRRRPALDRLAIAVAVLPTTYEAVTRELPALLARHDPDLVLLFGLASRARMLRIESLAVRAASSLHPDAARTMPPGNLFSGAPPRLKVNTPVQRLVAAARASGVPAHVSLDAGRYICNAALFACLDTARRTGRPARVAFVHIPRPRPPHLPSRALSRSGTPGMGALVRAGEAILRALAAHARHG